MATLDAKETSFLLVDVDKTKGFSYRTTYSPSETAIDRFNTGYSNYTFQ